MPSMAMLTTPLRSEITPPSAGRSSNAAASSVARQRSAVTSRWAMSDRKVMSGRRPAAPSPPQRSAPPLAPKALAPRVSLQSEEGGRAERAGEPREGTGDEHRHDDGPRHVDAGVSGGALALPHGSDLVAERRPPQEEGEQGQCGQGDQKPGVDAVDAGRQAEDDEVVVIGQERGEACPGSNG